MIREDLQKIDWANISCIWHDPIISYVANVYRTASTEINQECDNDITYDMWVAANNRLIGHIDAGVVSIYIIHALKEALYALCLVADFSSRESIAKAIDLLTKYEEFLTSVDMLKY